MTKTVNLRTRILLGYLAPLLLMAAVGGVVTWKVRSAMQLAAAGDVAHENLMNAQELELATSRMQSSARGYLLEKNQTSKETFAAQAARLPKLRRALDSQITAPEQLEILRKIADRTEVLVGILSDEINLVGAGDEKKAIELFKAGTTIEIGRELEALHIDFDRRENEVLATANQDEREALSGLIAVALGATAVAMLLAVAVLQNRGLNQRLEHKVLDQTAALQESARRFRVLFDRAPVGIAESSADGYFLIVNPRMCELTGYSETELQTRTFQGITHPEDQGLNEASLAESQAGRTTPTSVEKRYVRKDGLAVWVNVVATAVRGADGALHKVVTIVEDITVRKQADRELLDKSLQIADSLHEKEALLKEVHHRVKNNLQVISSLLRLEGGRIGHPETKDVLRSMQNRILSMAALHETLYRSRDFANVDLADYLGRLAGQLRRSLLIGADKVSLNLDLVPVKVDMDQAIPCGLIMSELVSNSLKHGFPESRPGEVRIELGLVEGGAVRLGVRDDGIGLPLDFHERKFRSLGLQLVSDLARQLGGQLTIGPGPASVFQVTFTPGRHTGHESRAEDRTGEQPRYRGPTE